MLYWWTMLHVQEDAPLMVCIFHPQGWSGRVSAESPIAVRPTHLVGFEMVVTRWRVVGCLPSFEMFATWERGPGKGTRSQVPAVHVARHGTTRSERNREAVPRSGVVINSPGLSNGAQANEFSRSCSTGVLVVRMWVAGRAVRQGWPPAHNLSQRGRAAASLDPIMYPIGKGRRTRDIHLHLVSFLPTNLMVYNM